MALSAAVAANGVTAIAAGGARVMDALTSNNSYAKVHGESALAPEQSHLSLAAQLAIQSTEQRLAEHEAKLAAYKANPSAFDNQGHLARNADNPEIVKRIIDGRVRHLEQEIKNFRDYIDGLKSGNIEP